jgi:probable HAF family extracellular repeat protein
MKVAFAVNKRSQVVGGPVNTVSDPFSPFGYEVHAFLWKAGVMEDLSTLGGPDATAYFVNERGQIAGTSFINSIANSTTGLPTQDPFLWENGAMSDLGTLGGTFGTPNFLDNHGRVIGQSNLAGDLSQHPFLWTKAQGMQDLGTFGGSSGQANWMNEKGEIVGFANSQAIRLCSAFCGRKAS